MKLLFLFLFPILAFAAPSPPLISAQAPLVLTNTVMGVSETLPFQVMTLHQQATPANPASTNYKLYFKSDGTLYSLNSSGTETPIGASPALGNLTSGTTGLTVTNGTDAVVGSGTSLTIQTASNSQPGLLSAADHTTFAAKQDALTIGNITSGTTGVSVGGGTGAIIGSGVTVSVQTASNSQPGLLSAADHTTFAAKQDAGSYITDLTSDVSASGPGSVAATVNSVGGSSAANVHAAELLANAATSANTASAIVRRGSSGEFSMGALTATGATFASPSSATGAAAPLGNVTIKSDATTGGFVVVGDGAVAVGAYVAYGTGTRVRGYRAGGTAASPTGLTGSGSGILQVEGYGYDGTTFAIGPSIQLRGTGTWSGSNHEGDVVINTVANASTAQQQAAIFGKAGNVTLGPSGNTTAHVVNGPVTMTGSSGINLLWATDGGGNVGASNATRPDNAYIKTLASVGDSTSGTNYLKLEATSAQISFGNSGSSWIGNGGVNAVMEAHGGGQAFIMDSTGFTHYGMVHLNPMTTATRDGYGGATGQFLYNSSLSRYQGYDGSYFSFVTPTSTDTLSSKTLAAPSISNYVDFAQISTPSNPSSSHNSLYAKSGNNFYFLNSSGTELQLQTVPVYYSLGNVTGATSIDWANGRVQYGTMTGAPTFTFSNVATYCKPDCKLMLTYDGTGNYAMTYNSVHWQNAAQASPATGGASKKATVWLWDDGSGSATQGSYTLDY